MVECKEKCNYNNNFICTYSNPLIKGVKCFSKIYGTCSFCKHCQTVKTISFNNKPTEILKSYCDSGFRIDNDENKPCFEKKINSLKQIP